MNDITNFEAKIDRFCAKTNEGKESDWKRHKICLPCSIVFKWKNTNLSMPEILQLEFLPKVVGFFGRKGVQNANSLSFWIRFRLCCWKIFQFHCKKRFCFELCQLVERQLAESLVDLVLAIIMQELIEKSSNGNEE